jgi:hypothetical protein
MIPNLKPELAELIQNISQKNTYSGNKVSDSIMRMFTLEETDFNCGITVPYWLGVLERGRGPRLKSTDHGLYLKIKKWMAHRNMFKSKTEEGHINEAKQLTWYINHYGNKQFNRGNPIFMDIYTTERKKTIAKIEEKFSKEISKITMDVL